MKVFGVGRLVRDLEVMYSQNGLCVAKFSIAENIYNYQTKDREAQFYNIIAFGKLAERIGKLALEKGEKLHIEGRLQIKDYVNKQGEKRKYTQIILDNFELCGRVSK